MVKGVIVDDEKKSRSVLRSLVEMYCDQVDIVGEAADIPSSLKLINEVKPDLVFLDISLKDGDSFMILDQLKQIDFNVIFITAFDEYSVRALNYSGIPCLYKPVDIEELVQVIDEVIKDSIEVTAHKYSFANQLLKSKFSKIPVLNSNELVILEQSLISSIRTIEKGVKVMMENGDEIDCKRTIKSFKEVIDPKMFYPVKDELLINLAQVNVPPERFRPNVVMKNGNKFGLDKGKLKGFWEAFKTI